MRALLVLYVQVNPPLVSLHVASIVARVVAEPTLVLPLLKMDRPHVELETCLAGEHLAAGLTGMRPLPNCVHHFHMLVQQCSTLKGVLAQRTPEEPLQAAPPLMGLPIDHHLVARSAPPVLGIQVRSSQVPPEWAGQRRCPRAERAGSNLLDVFALHVPPHVGLLDCFVVAQVALDKLQLLVRSVPPHDVILKQWVGGSVVAFGTLGGGCVGHGLICCLRQELRLGTD